MRHLTIIFAILVTGCATTDKWGCKKPTFLNKVVTQQAQKNYQACLNENDEDLKAERRAEEDWREKAQEARKFGTPKEVFDQYNRKPDREEIHEGKIVYWYNLAEPVYIIFKDGKLNSIIYDTETINARETQAKLDQIEANQRRARIQQSLGAMADGFRADSQRQQMNQMNNRIYQQQQQINTMQNSQGGPVRVINPGN